MNELLLVTAAPFKHHATNTLSIKDFDFSLSFDLKWMSPEDASKVRNNALTAGLIEIKDNKIIPTFNPNTVQIQAGFHPSGTVLEQQSLLDVIMQEISACSGKTNRNIAALISNKQELLANMVDIEIVALIIAKEIGCDINGVYQKVAASLYPNMQ